MTAYSGYGGYLLSCNLYFKEKKELSRGTKSIFVVIKTLENQKQNQTKNRHQEKQEHHPRPLNDRIINAGKSRTRWNAPNTESIWVYFGP